MNKKIVLLFVLAIVIMGIFICPKSFATTQYYGDVNFDGVVDSSDALLVQRYYKRLGTLNKNQLKVADVNGDNQVNYKDATLILKKSADLISIFPVEILYYGDINFDGVIDSSDALLIQRYYRNLTTLSDVQKTFADVDGDGNVTYNDANLILQKSVENISYFPVQLKYGDINLDNKLDFSDIQLLNNYCRNKATLSNKQLDIADINKDGFVNYSDYRLAWKLVGFNY